jgi:ferredoxin
VNEDSAPCDGSQGEFAERTLPINVSFRQSGLDAIWDDRCTSLLELAESLGIEAPFGCRAGLCGACETALLSGSVRYAEPPLAEPGDGRVLLCCSSPAESVQLDL